MDEIILLIRVIIVVGIYLFLGGGLGKVLVGITTAEKVDIRERLIGVSIGVVLILLLCIIE